MRKAVLSRRLTSRVCVYSRRGGIKNKKTIFKKGLDIVSSMVYYKGTVRDIKQLYEKEKRRKKGAKNGSF